MPSVIWGAEPSEGFSGRAHVQRGRTMSKLVGWVDVVDVRELVYSQMRAAAN